ncbi:MAG: hypothetical protein JWQ04_2228, partial [Pedosphaera sp.]|nr:hypothetical protein [Pedosphaera sp.]
GADSHYEYPHNRTQMQVRIEHHPEQIVSAIVPEFGAKQIVWEVFVTVAQLSAQGEIRVGLLAQGDILDRIKSVRASRRIGEITVVFIITELCEDWRAITLCFGGIPEGKKQCAGGNNLGENFDKLSLRLSWIRARGYSVRAK